MKIWESISLKPWNTFGIDVQAKQVYEIRTEQDLVDYFSTQPNSSFIVLGGGSNILFTQDIDKAILKIEISEIEFLSENKTHRFVAVGAGAVWHQFVLHCLSQDWAGVENLSLIPGTVGAAPIQNIGAYGVEIASVIHKVRYFDIESLSFKEIQGEDCAFGYRDSIFKNELKGKAIITQVVFALPKNAVLNTKYGAIEDALKSSGKASFTIQDVSNAVIQIRQSKLPDPAQIGNGGSFFKNPVLSLEAFAPILERFPEMPHYPQSKAVKIPAAWLIEQAGWKGYKNGNYGVHTHQALVLVNYGAASGKEIWQLSEQIIKDVQEKFSVQLEREINVLP